jgi:hypothetical protein
MSKPLTLLNREDKGDVDPGPRACPAQNLSARFPSYFGDFFAFLRFSMLRMGAAFSKRLVPPKLKVPLTAAFMAIV